MSGKVQERNIRECPGKKYIRECPGKKTFGGNVRIPYRSTGKSYHQFYNGFL